MINISNINIRNITEIIALPPPPEETSETNNKSGPLDYQPHIDERDIITPQISVLK